MRTQYIPLVDDVYPGLDPNATVDLNQHPQPLPDRQQLYSALLAATAVLPTDLFSMMIIDYTRVRHMIIACTGLLYLQVSHGHLIQIWFTVWNLSPPLWIQGAR